MDYGYHWWGMHLFWWIFWIALLGLIFFTPAGKKKTSKSNLLDTLRRTYAEGKISTQEFEERKRVLENEFLKQQQDSIAGKNEIADGNKADSTKQ